MPWDLAWRPPGGRPTRAGCAATEGIVSFPRSCGRIGARRGIVSSLRGQSALRPFPAGTVRCRTQLGRRVMRGSRPILRLCLALVAILLILLAVWNTPISSRVAHTCRTLCRATKIDRTYLGVRLLCMEETECSKWYQTSIEPTHEHVWSRSTCSWRFRTCWTMDIGSMWHKQRDRHSSPKRQIDIYQRFEDKEEARRLFISLANGKDREILDPLNHWAEAGFPTSLEGLETISRCRAESAQRATA